MIQYSNPKDRDELIARARHSKEGLDVSTRTTATNSSTSSSCRRIRPTSRSGAEGALG